MRQQIERQHSQVNVSIALGAAVSGAFDMRQFAGGLVVMPAAWTAAKIGFKHAIDPGAAFTPLYDKTGTLVEVTVAAGGTYVLPDEVFACHHVQLWSEAAGVNVAQAAARSLVVCLKG